MRTRILSSLVLATWLVAAVGVAVAQEDTATYREPVWVFDVLPASIHANLESEPFNVRYLDRDLRTKEEVSVVSTFPSLAVGAAFETRQFQVDLKVGGGMLLNTELRSPLLFGSAGLLFEVKRSIWLGPQIGVAWYADPEWWGDADIEFDDTVGLYGGLRMVMGDKISYYFSMDYYDICFDVARVGLDVQPSADELAMSGLGVQFGVRAQF